jgi:orotidine-5'-phosphate decarboxylase
VKPIFVAIDTPDLPRAQALALAVRDHAGGLKLGLEFFSANGPDGVKRLGELGLPVFLDLKLHDIPSTVAKAVEALASLRPAVLTVHAAGGRAMLEAAKAAAPAETKVVAVTVLTSLDGSDLDELGYRDAPEDQVARFADLAKDAGVDGIVCSGAEVGAASARWPEGIFVVPGVRPAGGAIGDQKRVVTPAQALDAGASILVIGRPISSAADPGRAIAEIADSLQAQARILS